MNRQDSSREYLNDLDRRAAVTHIRRAVDETDLAAHRVGDIIRRDFGDAWDRFDREMEDSRWPGGGPNRHAYTFTEWDAMKKAAADSYHKADTDLAHLKTQLQQQSIIRDPFLEQYSTKDLENGMCLHADFAQRYAKYAMRDKRLPCALQDGREAVRQGGMYARDAFEVQRRQVRDALLPMRDRLLKKVEDISKLDRPHHGQHSLNVVEAAGAAALAGAATAAGISLLRHEWEEHHPFDTGANTPGPQSMRERLFKPDPDEVKANGYYRGKSGRLRSSRHNVNIAEAVGAAALAGAATAAGISVLRHELGHRA